MADNIGYIVAPMGLTERQYLIYITMYKKCNFAGMTVKYTPEQIACDIRIINTNKDAVGRDIKKMIEQGYLNIISKGSKGNPTTYEIVKMCNLNATNVQPKCNLKSSDTKSLDGDSATNMRPKCKLSAIPIKEKEKENNIYSDSIQKIISLYPGKKIKPIRDKKLPGIIKKYGEEEIIRCVERYAKECKGKEKQFVLNESTFWNGRYIDYLDCNHQENTQVQQEKKLIDMY